MNSDPQLAQDLISVGVPTLHEANHRRGLMTLMRILVGDAFAGPAQTVALPAGDNLGIHVALEQAAAGSVLCIASAGKGLYGVVGELLVEAARARRLAAVVIYDGLRDIEHLQPPPTIAALGVSSRGTTKGRFVSIAQPIAIDHVLIRPGDWVVGDRNGVCVVGAESLTAVIASAKARRDHEDGLREQIRQGIPTTQLLGLRATRN